MLTLAIFQKTGALQSSFIIFMFEKSIAFANPALSRILKICPFIKKVEASSIILVVFVAAQMLWSKEKRHSDYFTEHVKTCSRTNEVEGSCKQ